MGTHEETDCRSPGAASARSRRGVANPAQRLLTGRRGGQEWFGCQGPAAHVTGPKKGATQHTVYTQLPWPCVTARAHPTALSRGLCRPSTGGEQTRLGSQLVGLAPSAVMPPGRPCTPFPLMLAGAPRCIRARRLAEARHHGRPIMRLLHDQHRQGVQGHDGHQHYCEWRPRSCVPLRAAQHRAGQPSAWAPARHRPPTPLTPCRPAPTPLLPPPPDRHRAAGPGRQRPVPHP